MDTPSISGNSSSAVDGENGESRRWITGTADRCARIVGASPVVVRLAFTVCFFASGWGALLYVMVWLALRLRGPDPIGQEQAEAKPDQLVANLAVGAVGLGAVLTASSLGLGFFDALVWPVALLALGIAVAIDSGHERESNLARIAVGTLIVVAGLLIVLFTELSASDAVASAGVVALFLGGIALVAGPQIWRLATQLDQERQMRSESEVRAEIAEHLHDSVLQTLMLIQRHADDPRLATSLARRQERELRSWLFERNVGQPQLRVGGIEGSTTLDVLLSSVIARIEDDHRIIVEVIMVGAADVIVDDEGPVTALVGAIAEAVTNAAKHAGVERVDVFVECGADRIEAFVRDTGTGFDLDQVPTDRVGITSSIIGRMERHGATVTIVTEPGTGTEVEISLPRQVRSGSSASGTEGAGL